MTKVMGETMKTRRDKKILRRLGLKLKKHHADPRGPQLYMKLLYGVMKSKAISAKNEKQDAADWIFRKLSRTLLRLSAKTPAANRKGRMAYYERYLFWMDYVINSYRYRCPCQSRWEEEFWEKNCARMETLIGNRAKILFDEA
jgi:hypothetical protein